MDTLTITDQPQTANYFTRFMQHGYLRVVPIIPPNAPISEGSSLFKRIGTSQDGRGKTPGIKGQNGLWFSFDWVPYEADDRDTHRWHNMGAGVGIKTGLCSSTGVYLIAIDADTKNEAFAKVIKDTLDELVGPMPIRIGNRPKALYLLICVGPVQYQRIDFGPNIAAPGKARAYERVEILSDGRQFVAQGIHPKTNEPYKWIKPIVPLDELPQITPQRLNVIMETLRERLPAASKLIKEGGTSEVSQASLRGDPAMVRKAVAALPNTSALFPSRESYRDIGYAIKASLPDNKADAFDIFSDWCDRWADGDNDPGVVAADWSRMKPPYRRGAQWLYELAEQHGAGGGFSIGEVWFDNLESPDNPFQALETAESGSTPVAIRATPYNFPDPSSVQPRQWLYAQHYIRKFVSATVAPSGVGKSSLEIVEALVMASGKPLLGVEPKGQFRVWLWNGEDPRDELERRIAAAMLHYQLTPEDIGDRLFVDSGRETEIILASDTREGARISYPVADAILRQITAHRIDVMSVDPFVSSHRVSENDNGAIDLVSKQWAKIADIGNCSIELVHHVRKLNGQEITVEDSRGASALLATARSARAISRMTRTEAARWGLENSHRRLFRFGDGKNNLAIPADETTSWFELKSVALGNGTGTPVDALLTGDHVGVVTRYEAEIDVTGAVDDRKEVALDIIRGGEWRRDIRAGETWVGAAIAQAMKMDAQDADDKGRLSAIVSAWIKQGALIEVVRRDAGRKQRTYVEVAEVQNVPEIDLFG